MGLADILQTIGNGVYSVKRWLAGTNHLYSNKTVNEALKYCDTHPGHEDRSLEHRLTRYEHWRKEAKERAAGFIGGIYNSLFWTGLTALGINVLETPIEAASKFVKIESHTVRTGLWCFVSAMWLSTAFSYTRRTSAITKATTQQELFIEAYQEHLTDKANEKPITQEAEHYISTIIETTLSTRIRQLEDTYKEKEKESSTRLLKYQQELEDSRRQHAVLRERFNNALIDHAKTHAELVKYKSSDEYDVAYLLEARAELPSAREKYHYDEIHEVVELDYTPAQSLKPITRSFKLSRVPKQRNTRPALKHQQPPRTYTQHHRNNRRVGHWH